MRSSVRARRDQEDDQLDLIFHALADRTRRALLRRLSAGPLMVSALARPLAMSRPAATKHLRVLEQAGLVVRAIDGRVHRCSLEGAPLRQVETWLADYRVFWDGALEALAQYAAANAPSPKRPGRAK